MRQIGLLCSEKMLETDTKLFLEFFGNVKKATQKASSELEEKKKEK
jgi:hypothetical protein